MVGWRIVGGWLEHPESVAFSAISVWHCDLTAGAQVVYNLSLLVGNRNVFGIVQSGF